MKYQQIKKANVAYNFAYAIEQAQKSRGQGGGLNRQGNGSGNTNPSNQSGVSYTYTATDGFIKGRIVNWWLVYGTGGLVPNFSGNFLGQDFGKVTLSLSFNGLSPGSYVLWFYQNLNKRGNVNVDVSVTVKIRIVVRNP